MSPSKEENSLPKKNKKIPAVVIIAILVLLTPFIAKLVADRYAVSKIDTVIGAFKGSCYGIYESAEYDLWTKSLKMKNFSIICSEEEAARFDAIKISDINSSIEESMPLGMLVEFDDAVINADAKIFGRFGEIASKIGMTAVHYRGIFSYSLSTSIDKFSFTINAENVGVTIGEIMIENPAPIDNSLPKTLARLLDTPISSLNITFKDSGFTDMALGRYAQTIGAENSIKALDRALHGLENRIRNISKNSPESASKIEEIYKFIQNPNEISINLGKEDEISVKEIIKSLDYSGWKGFANSFENFKPKVTAK